MVKILLFFLMAICTFTTAACDETPSWKSAAYSNGPIAEGRIESITVSHLNNRWSGNTVKYDVRLENGVVISLHEWEYRDARYPKVGDTVVIYYAWQSGHVIERR